MKKKKPSEFKLHTKNLAMKRTAMKQRTKNLNGKINGFVLCALDVVGVAVGIIVC